MLDPGTLVDLREQTVDPRVFNDPRIYELEQERLFGRCWLYLGHESQLGKPGDFIASFMGEEPVVVCRDLEGRVRAFLNSCRHRGMKVCRLDEGNTRSFRCPYHGWTYDLGGRLVGVPEYRTAYHEALDRSRWGLISPPRVESYHGLIFASFDEAAPPLTDYLGEIRWYLDMLFDRTSAGLEGFAGTHRWTLKTNWKFGAEQFSGDNYHAMWAHESAVKLDLFNQFGGADPWVRDFEVQTRQGHGWINFAYDLPGALSEVIEPYMERLRGEALRRLTPLQVKQIGCVHVGTVFPNFSILSFLGFHNIRVWQPRGPDRVEIWSGGLIERGAPPAVQALARDTMVRTFSPAGIFEQDDGEMWTICHANLRGTYRKRFALNYQMGSGYERADPERPGRLHPPPSEIGIFGFYRRWAELMAMDGRAA